MYRNIVVVLFVAWSLTGFLMAAGIPGDIDGSGRVDGRDLAMLAGCFGVGSEDPLFLEKADLDHSGTVDGSDLAVLSRWFGAKLPELSGVFEVDRVVVGFREPEVQMQAGEVAREFALEVLYCSRTGGNFVVYSIPGKADLREVIWRLLQDDRVSYAEPDHICRALFRPNDPWYGSQWNLDMLETEGAWETANGGDESVRIAVLDTGVAYEDSGSFCRLPDFSGICFKDPYDFVDNDGHSNDENNHGTVVSGIVAARTNNARGIAGIAYRCCVMPLRVLNQDGVGTAGNLADAIRYAADHGADVLNMSLGFDNKGVSNTVNQAVRYAYERDVIVVSAAGNNGDDPEFDGWIDYPGAAPEAIAVGAVNINKDRANYSSFGPAITCVAPGGDFRGQILADTFAKRDVCTFFIGNHTGTSMATPHVAAVAGLVRSLAMVSPDEFVEAIRRTSEDRGPSGFDEEYGYGLINARKLVDRFSGGGGDKWGWNN